MQQLIEQLADKAQNSTLGSTRTTLAPCRVRAAWLPASANSALRYSEKCRICSHCIPTSDLRPPTSDLRPPTSDLCPLSSVLCPLSSVLCSHTNTFHLQKARVFLIGKYFTVEVYARPAYKAPRKRPAVPSPERVPYRYRVRAYRKNPTAQMTTRKIQKTCGRASSWQPDQGRQRARTP
jgi:hypothetical protein